MDIAINFIKNEIIIIWGFVKMIFELFWESRFITIPLLLIYIFICIIRLNIKYNKFKKSSYGEISGNGFINAEVDLGMYGEYLTYEILEKVTGYKRLLTNIYLPKENGDTTEIDLVMIHETGIYVIESKNYSGWIYGRTRQRYWTVTLDNREKHKLYNPIWQNYGHIEQLKKIIPNSGKYNFESYIVFSERCAFKKVSHNFENAVIINRNQLADVIVADIIHSNINITKEEVDNIYNFLVRFSKVDEETKRKHIENINVSDKL